MPIAILPICVQTNADDGDHSIDRWRIHVRLRENSRRTDGFLSYPIIFITLLSSRELPSPLRFAASQLFRAHLASRETEIPGACNVRESSSRDAKAARGNQSRTETGSASTVTRTGLERGHGDPVIGLHYRALLRIMLHTCGPTAAIRPGASVASRMLRIAHAIRSTTWIVLSLPISAL